MGGHTFLESVPPTWRYADLMFSLAEKVDGAVSVKFQLPGEELDPDSLISVADDGDIDVSCCGCSRLAVGKARARSFPLCRGHV